jgi:hypothetical protein
MVQDPHELEVLAPGQVLVDRRVLARQADDRAQRVRVADDVVPGDPGLPPVGRKQRRQDADHGRLARAVGAQQPEDRTARDLYVDAIERVHVSE